VYHTFWLADDKSSGVKNSTLVNLTYRFRFLFSCRLLAGCFTRTLCATIVFPRLLALPFYQHKVGGEEGKREREREKEKDEDSQERGH